MPIPAAGALIQRRTMTAILLLAVVTASGRVAVAGRPAEVDHQDRPQAALPSGHWTSFAHGNDILALQGQGDVLWAGTRIGGLVRWLRIRVNS